MVINPPDDTVITRHPLANSIVGPLHGLDATAIVGADKMPICEHRERPSGIGNALSAAVARSI
jgi:hypothetical protein